MSAERTSTELEAPRLGSGAMFDRIAKRYDLVNRVLSLGLDQGWRRRAVRSLGLSRGRPSRVLDLATGTADLALLTARLVPDATIVGLDPSRGMLAVGREKVRGAGLEGRVELAEGEAEAIPMPDASFDGATMAFGIRNVVDRPRALREIARVLAPGARVAILELTEPRGVVLGRLARFHVHVVVPRVGALLSGADEYRYLEQSIARFPPGDSFRHVIDESGLELVTVAPMLLGVAHLFVAARPRAGG
jgi:demethylmenaquinone methyltransferase/2-methoxy-6-polyprenyl-1,4-benzoquinol methylase